MKKSFLILAAAATILISACSGNSASTGKAADTTAVAPNSKPDSAANNSIVPPSAAPGNATNSSLADTTYHAKDSVASHKLKH